jgi:hypothetical protein
MTKDEDTNALLQYEAARVALLEEWGDVERPLVEKLSAVNCYYLLEHWRQWVAAGTSSEVGKLVKMRPGLVRRFMSLMTKEQGD